MTDTVVIPPEVALPLIRNRALMLAGDMFAHGLDQKFVDALDGIVEDLTALAAQLPAVA